MVKVKPLKERVWIQFLSWNLMHMVCRDVWVIGVGMIVPDGAEPRNEWNMKASIVFKKTLLLVSISESKWH